MKFFGLFLLFFCLTVTSFPNPSLAETESERRFRLEAELQVVERQILTQSRLVEDKQSERQSLERDVAIIEGQIKQSQLGIQARAVAIMQLNDQIDEKSASLSVLEDKKKKQLESLGDLIRKSAQLEEFSLVEVMFSKQNFSDFFSDVATFQALKESLSESLAILKRIQSDTNQQKNQLETKQDTEAEMKRIQELQKKEIERKESEKAKI
jgi:septal ring factor EnvC (AmiA/AmiB activator)